ncbi:metallophosphoesterase [Actinomadura alba]|uniref:Metallophosphoesterase n=1 Tax=Actinomadura alba TaxID=406431 RepID=A0ABR7LWU7_9ACTN|nr:metallophosphoesterase [Actinomadura alba]MBC6469226.1 metallophosphoesterase [Actinomadura alba]
MNDYVERRRRARWRRPLTAAVLSLSALISTAQIAHADASAPALSLAEGQVVRGQITVYAGGAPESRLSLELDGTAVTAEPASSLPATVLFEADGIQSGSQRLLNSVWVNGEMVTLINRDYSGFATVAVPLPAGSLHDGANRVTVRAGDSVSPTSLAKNHDDFTIRNVRLRLLDGTELRDPAVPADRHLSIGDGYPGGNATEEQVTRNFGIGVPAERLRGVSYDLDTRPLTDGPHTMRVVAGDDGGQAHRDVTFRVDNTAPRIISTSPAAGERVNGGDVTVQVNAIDSVSGVAGATAVLDGRAVPVPDRFPVENIPAGSHQLTVTVTDAAGNADTETIRFSTVEVPIARGARDKGRQDHGPVSGPDAPVLAAAGDVACAATSQVTPKTCHQAGTAALVRQLEPDAVAMLADGQYDVGTLEAFNSSYDKTWGTFKDITHPAVGNHEYAQAYYPGARADGYFDYFNGVGAADGPAGDRQRGYYSYDLGRWHVVALNGECGVVSCAPGSGQYRWLEQDLRAHRNKCTLAYWHKPLFSALYPNRPANPDTKPLWQVAERYGVDVVLNGHDHSYQRFDPQNADGAADPAGPRQFTVGTGGVGFHTDLSPTANLAVANADTFGVLKLTLRPTGYDWRFVPEPGNGNGTFTDAGSAACGHLAPGQARK